MDKICVRCKESGKKFYDGYTHCTECVSTLRRERYLQDRTYYLNNRYNVMKQRAEGRYSYPTGSEGKPIMTREEFLEWCVDSKDAFDKLWEEYERTGYNISNAPSVDRIDSERGYERGNIQWMRQSENSSKGNRD